MVPIAETDLNYETDLTPAITSLSSLASDVTAGLLAACSAAIDNTAGLYLDAMPSLTVVYPNSAPTTAYLTCYYAHEDGNGVWSDDGYSDSADGTDQTITIGSPTCLVYAGTVPILQNKTTTRAALRSIATAFGFVPKKVCVVVHNGTGQTVTSGTLRVTCVTAVTA